jgi:hypothetical protein
VCEVCAHAAHVQKNLSTAELRFTAVSMRFSLTEEQRATPDFGCSA